MSGNHVSSQSMEVRNTCTHREAADLRVVPRDGEEDRRVQEVTEVVAVARVLPKIIRIHYQELSRCLLKSSVKLIALTGTDRRRRTPEKSVNHRISGAGKDQIL